MTNYYGRLMGTALGFGIFGIGASLISMTVIPLLCLFYRDEHSKTQHVRSVIRRTFKLFLDFLELIGVLELETQNIESIEKLKGTLIICNHPSLLDVLIIMSRTKNIQCIVKSSLWYNPFIGSIVRAAGYIRNDTDPMTFLEDCQAQLKKGENILIFPEGTRTTPGQHVAMHRGLGNLALASNVDIQALHLTCNPTTLTKHAKWYQIPEKRISYSLTLGPYFPIKEQYGENNELPRSLKVRALMREIQNYYNKWLEHE